MAFDDVSSDSLGFFLCKRASEQAKKPRFCNFKRKIFAACKNELGLCPGSGVSTFLPFQKPSAAPNAISFIQRLDFASFSLPRLAPVSSRSVALCVCANFCNGLCAVTESPRLKLRMQISALRDSQQVRDSSLDSSELASYLFCALAKQEARKSLQRRKASFFRQAATSATGNATQPRLRRTKQNSTHSNSVRRQV